MTSRLCFCWKNVWTCAATIGPTSGTSWMLLLARLLQRLERAEVIGERRGRRLADVANAERIQEARAASSACCCSSASTRFAADFSPMRSSAASCSSVSV